MLNERSDRVEKLRISFARHFVRPGFVRRIWAGVLLLMLAAQSIASVSAQQPAPGQQQVSSSAQSRPDPNPDAIPDSPVPARADHPANDQNQQSPPPQQSGEEPKPVGTAVAPYVKPSGIAASRPAGAAIAPAKQRRSHAFVIKVALIAGAAAAGGAVVALSAGSRSRPQ